MASWAEGRRTNESTLAGLEAATAQLVRAAEEVMARIQDGVAIMRKMLRDPACRGCGTRGGEGHHIILRSHGGDDVEDNIFILCRPCHDHRHAEGKLEVELAWNEVAYVVQKLGGTQALTFLERRYCWH